ncbi:hypothetical protein QVD17_26408 [Tagetes erecta]|uniref:Uncharacterized protein n=1 Tax=Tagetes erecta TaxID=13708 RepID=A0AAD8KAZ7_TARER|nr:hypothetical protein QVD17_26408 [Tagetes erecta]
MGRPCPHTLSYNKYGVILLVASKNDTVLSTFFFLTIFLPLFLSLSKTRHSFILIFSLMAACRRKPPK